MREADNPPRHFAIIACPFGLRRVLRRSISRHPRAAVRRCGGGGHKDAAAVDHAALRSSARNSRRSPRCRGPVRGAEDKGQLGRAAAAGFTFYGPHPNEYPSLTLLACEDCVSS